MRKITFAAVTLMLLTGSTHWAAKAAEDREPVLKGKAAFGGWREDKPGVRRLIRPQDLPPIGKSVTAFSEVVPMPEGAKPSVPPGFSVELVKSGLANPRAIRLAPNGDLFVADSMSNSVHVFRFRRGAHSPTREEVFARDLHQPYGIAFYPPGANPEWIYIANSDGVVRYPYKNGDLKRHGYAGDHRQTHSLGPSLDARHRLLAGRQDVVSLRRVRFECRARHVSAAAHQGRACKSGSRPSPLGATWDTEERRADVLAFDPDGKNERIFATGLRNCSGSQFSRRPASSGAWSTSATSSATTRRSNTPRRSQDGTFYGWPWYYIGSHEDPRHKGKRADLKDKVTVPDVLIQAHSAPLQIVFYEGENFPGDV